MYNFAKGLERDIIVIVAERRNSELPEQTSAHFPEGPATCSIVTRSFTVPHQTRQRTRRPSPSLQTTKPCSSHSSALMRRRVSTKKRRDI